MRRPPDQVPKYSVPDRGSLWARTSFEGYWYSDLQADLCFGIVLNLANYRKDAESSFCILLAVGRTQLAFAETEKAT